MIDFLINNFGLIISISAIVISVALIVYWKIKDLITEYKATIQRLYNGVYAANLMLSVHSLLLVKNENNKQLLRLSTDEIRKSFSDEDWYFYNNYNYKQDFSIKRTDLPTK